MKIGIDARFAVRTPRRGIGTYSVNLLRKLILMDPSSEFVLYVDRVDIDGVLPSAPNVKIKCLWPSIYPLWEQFALPIAVYNDSIELLHTLGNTSPLFLPSRTRLVISLMDVMFLQSGEFIPRSTTLYQAAGRFYRASVAPRNANRSSAIITISDFSRNDILKLIPKVSRQKIVSIPLACDPCFTLMKQDTSNMSSRAFLLCLGANDARKNTFRIVKAYLNALKSCGLEHDLIICGYKNWEGSPSHRLVKKMRAETRVKCLPFVNIEDLRALYQQASGFLYVSLYEGFGIPLLEAFSMGCPVIASDTTSIPEVAGDAVLYVDPLNYFDIEKAIIQLCSSTLLQDDLKVRGRLRAKQFSWERTASETLTLYQKVYRVSESF